MSNKLHYNTGFISDAHLFMRGIQSDMLLEMFENTTFKRLYLVGDICDPEAIKRCALIQNIIMDSGLGFMFKDNDRLQEFLMRQGLSEMDLRVLDALIRMCEEDKVEIIATPGNHDDILREYFGSQSMLHRLFNIEADHGIFVGPDGRRHLYIHGDRFDDNPHRKPDRLRSHLRHTAYNTGVSINGHIMKQLKFF